MNEKTLTGYHATYSTNTDSILKNGFNYSISTDSTLQWLGKGIYFWEDDFYAVQWNVIDMERVRDKEEKDYSILKAIIRVNKTNLFDISSPEGSIVYTKFKEELINKWIKEGKQDIANRLKNRSSKFWINILEEYGFFEDFDVVIATYKNEKTHEKYKDDIIMNAQRQICVKNNKCIQSVEIYGNTERISELYKIILSKRKENYEENKKVTQESE